MDYRTPGPLHADMTVRAVVDTQALDWLASPSGGVERRMLDRDDGGEVARATSLVRYAAGSTFPRHEHALGEEYFVLEGTFSDEDGDSPTGTYVRNPPGSGHTPFTRESCTIFVKLRQMRPNGEPHLRLDTGSLPWRETGTPGYRQRVLFEPEEWRERVHLEQLAPGAAVAAYPCPAGEEFLVLEGSVADGRETHGQGVWVRNPPGSVHGLTSRTGCILWVKRGHLQP